MKHYIKSLLIILTLCFSCSSEEANYISPIEMAIDKANHKIYVSDYTSKLIREVDLKVNKAVGKVELNKPVKALYLDTKTNILYGATYETQSKLFAYNTQTKNLKWIGQTGHSASDIKLYQNKLYVANQFSNSISIFDLKSKKTIKTLKTRREPYAIAIQDGNIWVANHLPHTESSYPLVSIEIFNPEFNKIKELNLPNGSTILKDMELSKDQKQIAVPHLLAHYQYPTNQLEKGWIYNNCVSLIDTKTFAIRTITLDDVDKGAANPYAVAFSDNGEKMIVSHSGTDELSIIDYKALVKKLEKGQGINQGVTDYSFLVEIRKRVKLGTEGANKIVCNGDKIYTSAYFSGNIAQLTNETAVQLISLGTQKPADKIRLGEIAFHTGKICFQNWLSCASCHPGDARVDGLNWDNLNDGIGNPKNTKSMLLSHITPPAMVTGIRATAEVAVRAGMKHMFLYEFKEETAEAIDEYLFNLKAVESPYLVNGKLSAKASKGKEIFKKADCAKCHYGEQYTDMEKYDVGTGIGVHKNTKFDTPALNELWRTAPYLYDGRSKTIMDVLTTDNSKDLHGKTSNLTKEELENLAEYLLSI